MTSFGLPIELIDSLKGLPGFDPEAFAAVHAAGGKVVSVRVNPAKVGAVRLGESDPGGGGAAALNGGALDAGALSGGGFSAGVGAFSELASGEGAAALWPGAIRVPWSSYGYYLPERPSFTFDPLFHAGAYYVQEASSMFLEQALRQTVDLSRPLRVLDLCGAPGGKSTLLQSLISSDSLLVSNEVIRNRVHILQENIVKWGAPNVFVTSNDPADFGRLENYFDVVVVDAPCSGSGLFRREPEAIAEWSLDNVRLCEQRQQRILADCWPALREDGILIYSTCSYSREEDEDILDWLVSDLEAVGVRLDVPAEWGIVETMGKKDAYGYRFYPDKVDGEGFFIAALRKKDGGEFVAPRKKGGLEKLSRAEEERVREWIAPGGVNGVGRGGVREGSGAVGSGDEVSGDTGGGSVGGGGVGDTGRRSEELSFFKHMEVIHALPTGLEAELTIIQKSCYLKRAGIPMGKLSPKEFIPEHDLAVSTIIRADLPVLSLSKEDALVYLRKEEVSPGDAPLGWTLVAYEGLNLGWIKVLPRRSNNYYPKEWRILKR